MECSKCHRIWHVGGPTCPRCGGPPVEAVETSALYGYRLKGREPSEEEGVRSPATSGVRSRRLTRRDFIVAALAGGASATIAVLIPIAVGRDDGERPRGIEGPVGAEEPSAILLATYPRKRIASLSQLKEGEPIDFEYPLKGQQNFLVKLGTPANGGIGPDRDVVGFSYACTHMGCPLVGQYKHEHKIIGPCPCHYSTFDLRNHGMVVLGQATQNLPQVILDVEGDDIYATGVMGLVYGFHNNLVRSLAPKEAP